MSQYSHSLRKFADAGLQLRLPVDLIPAIQYGKLTNALPIIEGEIRTRDGLTLVQEVFTVAAIATLARPTNVSPNATIVNTIYPHGYVAGQTVTITVIANDPLGLNVVALGAFVVTIVTVTSPTQFTFTPAIPTTWSGVLVTAAVFAQATGSGPVQTLTQTAITNIFRLNQSLPTVPSDQLIAMMGRLYRANLAPPQPVVTVEAINFLGLNANTIAVQTVAPTIFPLGTQVTLSGLTTNPSLNGQTFVINSEAPVNIVRGPLVHSFIGGSPETGQITGLTTVPPAFIELVLPLTAGEPPSTQNGFSGRPLSIVEFRFTDDPASWAIIADGSVMAKYREQAGTAPYLFFGLGNYVPLQPASATAGAAGNLNSTGGALYDWRYTYYDGYVNTEGNPSPGTVSGSVDVQNSSSQLNPDPRFNSGGSFPFTNVAFTGVSNTGGTGTATQIDGTFAQTSCRWRGFSNPATTPFLITLSVTWQVTVTKVVPAALIAELNYSLDAGVTWVNFANSITTTGTVTVVANIPLSSNFTQIQVEAWGWCNPDIVTHQVGNKVTILITNIEIDSNLSPTSGAIALVNQKGVICVQAPTVNDGRITGIRLYRRGGSLPDDYRLVGTFNLTALVQGACGVGFLTITDNVPDTQLSAQPILQLDNDMPITSISATNQPLNFIWGPVGIEARMLGCGDPNRPEVVYFSKPGNPDAWPPQNFVETSEPGTPMVAGCIYNNQNFAFSRERIYQLVEGYIPGAVFTPFVTASAHGLFTPWGLAVGPAIFFVSKDGIYETWGGQERSIVENDIKPLFPTYDTPGQDVEGYEAVDMNKPDNIRLRYHNDELYFTYTGATTGTRQMLVYDILKKRWRAAHYATGISEVYSQPDIKSSLLLGTDAGSYYIAGGNLDPFELDVIENISLSSVTASGVTLGAGSYFVRMSRFSAVGEIALSNETSGITVSAVLGIQVVFPNAPAGTTKWRVYYGTKVGQESQYQEFTEAQVAAFTNRTTVIIAVGTGGAVPTVNADHNIAVVLRTGANDEGVPLNRKQYGNVIFDLDPGGATLAAPVTITPLLNGETVTNAAITVIGSGRQQVPLNLTDYFAFNTEYEVSWERTDIGSGVVTNPVLFQYDTLWFLEPVGVVHWQSQPTSFGFPGFVHCRDAYIAIRSTSSVTLTVTLDGTIVQSYVIPSTGGNRLKQYIQFASNKGLLYQFALDSVSTAEFRVYEPDLEIRVKPWLGVLGYAVQRVIGGEVNA